MSFDWTRQCKLVGSTFTHWIGCSYLALESALKNNNDKFLRQIYRDLSTKTQSCAFLSDRELLAQIGRTLHREFGAETYIPLYVKAGKKLRPQVAIFESETQRFLPKFKATPFRITSSLMWASSTTLATFITQRCWARLDNEESKEKRGRRSINNPIWRPLIKWYANERR